MDETRLKIYSAETDNELQLEFIDGGIKAGFPSPAQDYQGEAIDLNKTLIRHPATTFYARAMGDSMKGRGIGDGDLLVIDKSLEPQEGNAVVAFIDGEFTLKTLHLDKKANRLWLMPANEKYPPIEVTEDNNFIIWGVVTHNIKSQLRRR